MEGKPALFSIDVSLNDYQPVVGCLDTSNTGLAVLVTQNAATKLELPEEGKTMTATVGLAKPVDQALRRSGLRGFRFGPYQLSTIPSAVAVAPILTPNLEPYLDVMEVSLGVPLFRSLTLDIDLAGRILEISKEPLPPQSASFDFGETRRMILIDTFVNRRGPYYFALDTTAPQSIVSPELVSLLQLPIGAEGANPGVTLESLNFDHFAAYGLSARVEAVRGHLSASAGATVDGILGLDVLGRCRLTLDFPRRRILAQNGK
jgi:hypothetical protein